MYFIKESRMFKFFVFLISLVISANVFSNSTYTWHEGKVDRIYPQKDGNFIITFKNDSSLCTNASLPKYHYVSENIEGVNRAGVNAMLSVAMAAGMADKNLKVYFNKTSATCDISKLYVSM
jgi:hypothetical protein